MIIENEQPLRNSVLWNMQREFYDREGLNAWNFQVPFYVTSNPYIANSYANIILRFAQDSIKNGNANINKIFYIIELGAGSGTFSFYTIKRLVELQKDLGLENIKFVYVMTDLVNKNIDFWKQHPALKIYQDKGILDFALFDAEKDTELSLMISGKKLSPSLLNQTSNPLLVIANYVFDSMKNDIFYIENNKAMEAFTNITTLSENDERTLNNIQLKLTYKEKKSPCYEDTKLNAIIESYTQNLDQSYILMPTGAINCIKNFTAISKGRLCLLVSDKGYTRHLDQHLKEEPLFILHSGCFSLPVNFDALDKYFKSNKGSCYHQFTEHALVTSLFLQGMKLEDMRETKLAAETFLNEFGHASIFKMYEYLETTKPMFTIDTLLPFISATRYDPHIFNNALEIILDQIHNNTVWEFQLKDLAGIMNKIAENYYYIPGAIDTYFSIAVFFHEIKEYENALLWYDKSMQSGTKNPEIYFNMGICFYFIKNYDRALDCFKISLHMKPDYILARGWISQIQAEIHSEIKSEKQPELIK
jgi:tetratricopeptide (TPR) repeat protein